MKTINVIIADDHEMLREGLRLVLANQPDISVIGEATDGHEAIDLVRRLRPDVILLDIAMPQLNGLEAIPILHDISEQTRIVILSSHAKEAYVHQALQDGAYGYIVKGSPSSELILAIRKAASGQYYLSPDVQSQVIDNFKKHREPDTSARRAAAVDTGVASLSDRERQIFYLLVEGNSSARISDLLCISSKTVDKHRASICRKLEVETPIQMLHLAVRSGLVDPSLWQE